MKVTIRQVIGLVAIGIALLVLIDDDNVLASVDLVEFLVFALVLYFVLRDW